MDFPRCVILTQRAVAAVPALAAHAGAVLALAVLRAALVARQLVTPLPGPARATLAAALVTHSIGAALQAAQRCNTHVTNTSKTRHKHVTNTSQSSQT